MAEEKKSSKIGDVVKDTALVLSGAVVGVIGALLYAPQSGEKTRRQIARKYEDVKDQAVETAGDVKDKAQDFGRNVKKQCEAGVDYVAEKKDALVDTIGDKIGGLKKKLTGK